MIPKQTFTFWFSETGEMPERVHHCIQSQKLQHYKQNVITLENCFKDSGYIQQAIAAKKWVKLTDYLRMWYLYNEGGITLDSDVTIFQGKNFDNLLNNRMFAAREGNGFIGAAVLGAEKNYPFIKSWMEEVEQNFRGDDDKNFESSMDILVRGYFEKDWEKDGFVLVPTETFYPYSRQSGITNITQDTISIHHFQNSWVTQ